jgi:hypothetical protein
MFLKAAMHAGASFAPGADILHVWLTAACADDVRRPWGLLQAGGLAGHPSWEELAPGHYHASASVYPFLPRAMIERLMANAEIDDPAEWNALTAELDPFAHDAAVYRRSTGAYRTWAREQGWPAHAAMLGRHMCVVIGMGSHHRVRVMNVAEHTPFHAAVIGSRKCAGRDWLKAVGLPVAAGGLAATPQQAVDVATRAGFPVVIKRPIGGNGDGVILGVKDAQSCREAAEQLLVGQPHLVVEHMLIGAEFRVHLANGRIWEIRRVAHREIVTDGAGTIGDLIRNQHAAFWSAVEKSEWMRQRLVYVLWGLGARTFSDLEFMRPAPGARIRVSGAVVVGDAGLAPNALTKADRKRIEDAFSALGSCSGGVDVLLSHEGSSLAQGAVLEVNIPCGMNYLTAPDEAAATEMSAWFENAEDFHAAQGRVPLVLLPTCSSTSPDLWARVRGRMHARYDNLLEVDMAQAGWTPAIWSKADAVLMQVSEQAVLEHGLPLHSGATLLAPNDPAQFPLLHATMENTGDGARVLLADEFIQRMS